VALFLLRFLTVELTLRHACDDVFALVVVAVLNDKRDILVEEHLQVLWLQVLDFELATSVLGLSDEEVAGRRL